MKKRTLEELRQTVKARKETLKARQHKHYHLARSLGFSADEAVVLQNWGEESIRELAKQR